MLATAPSEHSQLPSWAWEAIANGARNDSDDMRPVFKVVHQVACSAVSHGWTETAWRNAMQDGVKNGGGRPSNKLWLQITTRRGRKLRFRTYDQFLAKAWAWAVKNLRRGFTPNPDREAELVALAEAWDQAIPSLDLTGTEARVLAHVCAETKRRKFLHVTCPVRGVADACNLSRKGVSEALISLRNKGLIICRSRGTWRGERPNHGGRAAIYRLADIANYEPARGAPTLHTQNPLDQQSLEKISPLLGHIDPARGAGMSKKLPYYQGDSRFQGGRRRLHDDGLRGDETLEMAR